MNDDREIARRALDFQARGRDYSLFDLPGYQAWSERKLDEGVSPALIAHLGATSMWLLPEEAASDGAKAISVQPHRVPFTTRNRRASGFE